MAGIFHDFTSALGSVRFPIRSGRFSIMSCITCTIVKKMSIRELGDSLLCLDYNFVSFCKKLGFSGYAEFTAMIQLTEMTSKNIAIQM